MTKAKIPNSLIDSLIEVASLDEQPLKELYESVVGASDIVFPNEYKRTLQSLNISAEDRSNLEVQLMGMNLFHVQAETKTSPEEMEQFVLEKRGDQSHDSDRSVASKARLIWAIASSKNMTRLNKLIELSYSHPDSLRSAKIVVDARPIFNDERSNIETYTILSFLQLNMYRHSEPELLSIYLDESDIRGLKECCESALEKINQTARQMANATGNPTFIPGVEKLSKPS